MKFRILMVVFAVSALIVYWLNFHLGSTKFLRIKFSKFYRFRNQRKLDIQKYCKNYKVRERINPTYFYFYNKTVSVVGHGDGGGLVWCKVPKIGSTTLTKLYLRLAGIAVEEDEHGDVVAIEKNSTLKVHKTLRQFYPKITLKNLEALLKLPSTVKFMVTRDPFERLVSAYRDKLEDYDRDLRFRDGYYYKTYGKYMLPAKDQNTSRVPTWNEFINYLLKTSIARFDEHWMPISRLCSPCATQYDYIINLDHFQAQIQPVLTRVGIQAPNLGWSHRTGSGNRLLIKKYFNNLTIVQIKKLYVKYRRDFQLFGYKPHKYFKLH